jgi:hypothetical protein
MTDKPGLPGGLPASFAGHDIVPDEGCIFIHIAPSPGVTLPPWARLAIAHGGGRELFVAAEAAPGGEAAALKAAEDATEVVNVLVHEGRPFLPLAFLERAFPAWAAAYADVRDDALCGLAEAEGGS